MKLSCPKAAKFNVSKKLSQLNKVIALFMTQAQEREFQLNYLHQKYNPEIDQVIQKACDYRGKLAQSVDKDKEDILNNYKLQYQQKYEQLVADLSTIIEKSTSLHQEKLENVENESATLKALIKSLLENSKEKQKVFLKSIEDSKAELSDRIGQLREKYKSERDAHSSEAEKRIKQCKKDSEERLKQLQSDHNDEMIKLRSENKVNVSIDSTKYEKGLQKLRDAAQLLMGHKNKILQMKESISKSIKNTKSQIDTEIQLIMKISQENKELLSKMDLQIDELEKPNQLMLEQLLQSQKDQLAQFADAEALKRNEFNELCAQLKQEYEDLKLKNKDALSKYNSIFGDLKKQQEEELEKLKQEHLRAANETELYQKKLNAEIKQTKQQFKKLKAQIKNEIDELKKKHEIEKSDIGHILYQEREAENIKHQNDMKILKDKLNAALGDDARKGMEAQENLNQLQNQKQQIIQDHNTEMVSFQAQEDDEFEQLKMDFANRSNELKNQISTSLDQLSTENEQKIQNTIDSNNQKKEELLKRLSIQNENELNGIQKVGFSRDEYKKLEANYQKILNQCQDELDKIQPPKLDDNEFYKSLMKTINELTKDVGIHTKKNSDEKSSILKKYTEEEENENKRHNEAIRPNSSGRARDQAKMGMMKQIDDVRTFKNSEIARYNKILEELIQKHRNEMSLLEDEKNKAMQSEQINKLKKDLEDTIKQGERKIQEHNNHFDSICNEKTKEIEKTTIHYIQESTSAHSLIDQLTSEFERLKNELLQKINLIQKNSEKDLENCQNCHDRNLFNLTNNHSMTLHSINQEINSLKSLIPSQKEKFEKDLKDNSSQRQNEIDEYVRSKKLEISDIKNKWKGMEAFFEEKLAVLLANRDKFKKLFEQRPSRDCDIERIAMLTDNLSMYNNQLSLVLNDYKNYKSLLVQQEKKYNAMFGKNPKVGTLRFTPSPRPTHV